MTKKVKSSVGIVVVYVLLIIWALTTIYPIIWVIQNSFKAKDKILGNSFAMPVGELFTMANYRKAFKTVDVFGAYKSSLFISTMVALLVILLAGMGAYALARYKFRGSGLVYSLVVGAMMFPAFATVISVFQMEYAWGIANTSSWFLNMLSVILPQVAGNMAFAMVVLTGYIKGLPIELEEAAYMEGCNTFQIYYKVFLPMMKGALMTQIILWFMGIWNDYLAPTIFVQDEKWYTLQVVIRSFNDQYAVNSNYPLIMAASVIAMLPTLLLFFFFQRYIIESMALSGVKG